MPQLRKHKEILLNAKKIAVVRTDRLGDMILTLPMCRALKENCPDAEITMIAQSYTKPLLENCPVLDNFEFIDKYSNGIKDIFKSNKYDAIFYPRPRFAECLAGFKARIPLRVGSAYRLYSFAMNHKVYDHRKVAERHEAEYNTRLIGSVLGKEVKTELIKPYVNPMDYNIVSDILSSCKLQVASSKEEIENGIWNMDNGMHQVEGKKLRATNSNSVVVLDKFIIIHPGSGGSARDLPLEKFAQITKQLYELYKIPILITGTQNESEQCRMVKAECDEAYNLSGKFSLSEMIALISKASLLIANSTGMLHIAAALNIPVVGLFPNSPHLSQKRWGPYSKLSRVVNPPSDGVQDEIDNMDLIEVEMVVIAASEIL